MARVCIAKRQCPSGLVNTALVLAAVVMEPVTSAESLSAEVPVVDTPASSEAVETAAVEAATPVRKNDKETVGKIVALAGRMAVLSDFVKETENKAFIFEDEVLKDYAAKLAAGEEGYTSEGFDEKIAEWSALKFPRSSVRSLEDVMDVYKAEFIAGVDNQKAQNALDKARREMLSLLGACDDHKLIIDELHKYSPYFDDITPESVKQGQGADFQELMKWLMQAQANKNGAADFGDDMDDMDDDYDFDAEQFGFLSNEDDQPTESATPADATVAETTAADAFIAETTPADATVAETTPAEAQV